jgi:leucyl aminopeptidase
MDGCKLLRQGCADREPGQEPRVNTNFTKASSTAIPITPVSSDGLRSWLAKQPARLQAWVKSARFDGSAGSVSLVTGRSGALERVLLGTGAARPAVASVFAAGLGGAPSAVTWRYAGLPARLPLGTYRIDARLSADEATKAALGWALGCYAYTRYRKKAPGFAKLVWPQGCDIAAVERTAAATSLARDLITTPASHMGPAELAVAAVTVAKTYRAKIRMVVGDDLLKQNYPAIHAVGRASAKAPRLIDITWGDAKAPKVTLIGKGVCFDTGGYDLKPSSGMKLMKKDMAGAAQALALGQMVMAANLPVRLRILMPAVENMVDGNAILPLDVIATRKGISVEIGNTDAEGRLILCDAIADAVAEEPAVMFDFATLTGAARTALGTEVPVLFSNDENLAQDLLRHGATAEDPMWPLPLWRPYRDLLNSKTADINNISDGPYAGAITAALFLQEFVPANVPWAHLDFMGWTLSAKPGRPEGGEPQGMRAIFSLLEERFGKGRTD